MARPRLVDHVAEPVHSCRELVTPAATAATSARQAGQDERSKRNKAGNLHPNQPASQRVYAPIELAALLGDGLLDAIKAGVGLAVLLGQLLGDAFQPSNTTIVVLGLRYGLIGHGVAPKGILLHKKSPRQLQPESQGLLLSRAFTT